MATDLPPWAAVYQPPQRWLAAGCFEALGDDLRAVLRLAAGHEAEPSAATWRPSRRPTARVGNLLTFLFRDRRCTLGAVGGLRPALADVAIGKPAKVERLGGT